MKILLLIIVTVLGRLRPLLPKLYTWAVLSLLGRVVQDCKPRRVIR